jgi:hypothetical protein
MNSSFINLIPIEVETIIREFIQGDESKREKIKIHLSTLLPQLEKEELRLFSYRLELIMADAECYPSRVYELNSIYNASLNQLNKAEICRQKAEFFREIEEKGVEIARVTQTKIDIYMKTCFSLVSKDEEIENNINSLKEIWGELEALCGLYKQTAMWQDFLSYLYSLVVLGEGDQSKKEKRVTFLLQNGLSILPMHLIKAIEFNVSYDLIAEMGAKLSASGISLEGPEGILQAIAYFAVTMQGAYVLLHALGIPETDEIKESHQKLLSDINNISSSDDKSISSSAEERFIKLMKSKLTTDLDRAKKLLEFFVVNLGVKGPIKPPRFPEEISNPALETLYDFYSKKRETKLVEIIKNTPEFTNFPPQTKELIAEFSLFSSPKKEITPTLGTSQVRKLM